MKQNKNLNIFFLSFGNAIFFIMFMVWVHVLKILYEYFTEIQKDYYLKIAELNFDYDETIREQEWLD